MSGDRNGVANGVDQASAGPRSEQRQSNAGYRLGGVTGKGFMPGQSGNPSGRPKDRVSREIIAILESQVRNKDGTLQEKTYAQALAEAFVAHTIKGNSAMAQQLMDRCFGKVPQKHEIGGDPDNPTPIAFVPAELLGEL